MSRLVRRLTVTFALVATGLLGVRSVQAQFDAAVGQHLRNGEFAPAVNMANRAPGRQRDDLLNRIAQAQAAAGLRRQAINTASSMGDDVARGRALGGIAGAPVGNFGGQLGGMGEPDFAALMDLIRTTVQPESWDDAGGPGSMAEFEGGVRVDAKGLVHSLLTEDATDRLRALRHSAIRPGENDNVRRNTPLRKVSLTRLEREVQLRLALGEELDEEMYTLAGLQEIDYVFVYPQTGDIVFAGPAGDWTPDAEGRLVGVESNHPVLQLDDLIVVLRHMTGHPDDPFGCSITPIREHLARTQQFLNESARRRLRASQRGKWLKDLQEHMGQQRVEYYGVDPSTRVARVLFEADYRMKLVGIGLEEGTIDTPSYLSMVKVPRGQAPPPMGVLRWWFTLNYDSILSNQSNDAYELRGQGVQVLSENELLDATGRRIHTGRSDPLTAEFARRFTKHFPDLARKYPIYAELNNIFDLALACSLIEAEDLPAKVGWHMTLFGDPQAYQVARGHAPELVETVINHRIINGKDILAAASGGVRVDPARYTARGKIEIDRRGVLGSKRDLAKPEAVERTRWWWD